MVVAGKEGDRNDLSAAGGAEEKGNINKF